MHELFTFWLLTGSRGLFVGKGRQPPLRCNWSRSGFPYLILLRVSSAQITRLETVSSFCSWSCELLLHVLTILNNVNLTVLVHFLIYFMCDDLLV